MGWGCLPQSGKVPPHSELNQEIHMHINNFVLFHKLVIIILPFAESGTVVAIATSFSVSDVGGSKIISGSGDAGGSKINIVI